MGPTPAKVGTIMTGIHRQPVMIPDLSPGGKRAQVRREIWDQSLLTVRINTRT